MLPPKIPGKKVHRGRLRCSWISPGRWAGPNAWAPSAACRRKHTVRYSPSATSNRRRALPMRSVGTPGGDAEQVRLTPDGQLPARAFRAPVPQRAPGAPVPDEGRRRMHRQGGGRQPTPADQRASVHQPPPVRQPPSVRQLAPVRQQRAAQHCARVRRQRVTHPERPAERVAGPSGR